MAVSDQVKIKFKCGHTQAVDLGHVPAGRRKGHAFGLGKNRVCSRCFATENAAGKEEFLRTRRLQELAEAEGFESEFELEPLTGSEKQLEWGTVSRYKLLSKAMEALAEAEVPAMTMEDFDADILVPARAILRAGWWISNSDAESEDLHELVTTAAEADGPAATETENPF